MNKIKKKLIAYFLDHEPKYISEIERYLFESMKNKKCTHIVLSIFPPESMRLYSSIFVYKSDDVSKKLKEYDYSLKTNTNEKARIFLIDMEKELVKEIINSIA